MNKTVFVVVGAKGGTGKEIVKSLLSIKDENVVSEVRAVVRNPATTSGSGLPTDDARLKVLRGDCSRPDTLAAPFEGARAVFYAAAGRGYEGCKAVDREGVREAGRLAKKAEVDRFVLVSSQLVDPINYYSFIRGFLNTINTGLFHWKGMMDFKFMGEKYLQASGQAYTIIRPGRLGDLPPRGSGRMLAGQNNGSFAPGSISGRADVARVCVAAAFSKDAENMTIEIGADASLAAQEGPEEMGKLFVGLKRDSDRN